MSKCPLSSIEELKKQKRKILLSLKGGWLSSLLEQVAKQADEITAQILSRAVEEIENFIEKGMKIDMLENFADTIRDIIGSINLARWLMYLIDYQLGKLEEGIDDEIAELNKMLPIARELIREELPVNSSLYQYLNRLIEQTLRNMQNTLDPVANDRFQTIKNKVRSLGYSEQQAENMTRLLQIEGNSTVIADMFPDIQISPEGIDIRIKEEKQNFKMIESLWEETLDEVAGSLTESLLEPLLKGVQLYEIYSGDDDVLSRFKRDNDQLEIAMDDLKKASELFYSKVGVYMGKLSTYDVNSSVSSGLFSGKGVLGIHTALVGNLGTILPAAALLQSIYNPASEDMSGHKQKIMNATKPILEQVKELRGQAAKNGPMHMTGGSSAVMKRLWWYGEFRSLDVDLHSVIEKEGKNAINVERAKEFYNWVKNFYNDVEDWEWGTGEPEFGLELLMSLLAIALNPAVDISGRIKSLIGKINSRVSALREMKRKLRRRPTYEDSRIESVMDTFSELNFDDLMDCLLDGSIFVNAMSVKTAMLAGLPLLITLFKTCIKDAKNDPSEYAAVGKLERIGMAQADIKNKIELKAENFARGAIGFAYSALNDVESKLMQAANLGDRIKEAKDIEKSTKSIKDLGEVKYT